MFINRDGTAQNKLSTIQDDFDQDRIPTGGVSSYRKDINILPDVNNSLSELREHRIR